MKNLIISLFSLLLIGFAGFALAGKSAKTIRHCGCTYDYTTDSGTEMLYHDVTVAGKSGGHNQHTAGTLSDCWLGTSTLIDDAWVPDTEEWMRTGSDCSADGNDANLADCGEILEGTDCGDVYQAP
jgi:hypothetical protein